MGEQSSVSSVKKCIDHDGFKFNTDTEVRVYEGLKRAQGRCKGDNLLITPLPGVKLPNASRIREPDFLVSYKGRSGMIEMDGGSHQGRWSNDKSRDRLFEDAGVAYVDHIDAEDVKRR